MTCASNLRTRGDKSNRITVTQLITKLTTLYLLRNEFLITNAKAFTYKLASERNEAISLIRTLSLGDCIPDCGAIRVQHVTLVRLKVTAAQSGYPTKNAVLVTVLV